MPTTVARRVRKLSVTHDRWRKGRRSRRTGVVRNVRLRLLAAQALAATLPPEVPNEGVEGAQKLGESPTIRLLTPPLFSGIFTESKHRFPGGRQWLFNLDWTCVKDFRRRPGLKNRRVPRNPHPHLLAPVRVPGPSTQQRASQFGCTRSCNHSGWRGQSLCLLA